MDYTNKNVDKYMNRIGIKIDEYYSDKDKEDNMNNNAELNKVSNNNNETMDDKKNYELIKHIPRRMKD
ncbi:hypothetical protein F8M41_001614 [Gigaspora margarita]|uniref:Uncharacterized protein n=1 Tax=Gigaspora margarita TaxID=4874 RepID=A0A8H4AYW5_GIGMA|nr:hypothetical protein F8M41_001614 [Gigaspora margarita]